jgi:hypothetical protein
MKTKHAGALFLAFCLLMSYFLNPVQAQDEPALTIRLSRDFGAAIGGRIEGTFSMHVSGPDTLERVVFYLDDERLGEDSETPFRLQFNTSSFSPGVHTLTVTGFTTDGQELSANTITATFMSAEESRQQLRQTILPVIIGAVALSVGIPVIIALVTGRKTLAPGSPRTYGVAGGAICPRCHRAYPRHVLSPNLLLGKLERCPFCGKWAVVRAVPPVLLAAAEEAERQGLEEHVGDSPQSEEDKLRHRLDDSRFEG